MRSSSLITLSELYLAVLISCVIVGETNALLSATYKVDDIEHGFYTVNGQKGVKYVTIGEKVTVSCETGYELSGCYTLQCEQDGVLRPVIPDEEMPSCSDINECQIVPSNTYEGSYSLYSSSDEESEPEPENECTYVQQYNDIDCHENAQCVNTEGSYKCDCKEDHVGDGVSTCEYVPPKCDVLQAPTNGYIVLNTTHNTDIACDKGYALRGSRKRTCRSYGWDGIQPICERTGCGDPGTPKDGFKFGDRYEPGNSVTFACNASYILKGSSRRVCTDEKRWSGWQPVCKPPKTISDIAGDIRVFVDKFDQYTDSAQGRLSRGNSVGLELVFAFDKSSSVGRINFQRGLNFTKKLIHEFGVGIGSSSGTRVAAVSFANEAQVEFNFDDDVDTVEKVYDKLDAMEGTLGGGTAMQEALEKVRLEIIPNMRNNSKKALFIVTDGHANTEDPVIIAEDLRNNQDVEIFAVGIGNDVDREQIRTVANKPYTSHVFLINNYEDLARITEIIAEKRTDFTRCGVAGDWELPEGENEAKPNAWPWIAHVRRDDSLYCEGALICEQWVVVAARCLDGYPYEPSVVPKEKLSVEFGNHLVFENQGCEQNATVVEIHRPETYSNETYESDIALLKLDHSLQLVNCIRTICLPIKNDFFNFRPNVNQNDDDPNRCRLAGWSSERVWKEREQVEQGIIPQIPHPFPRQVIMPLVANSKCQKHAGVELTDNMMCAGNRYKTSEEECPECTECTGQTGSPLVCRRDDDSWSMMGVLSDGSGCSKHNKYSYFTEVYNYIDWINTVTEECHEGHVRETVGGL